MTRTKRPPKEELLPLVKVMTDREIGTRYNVRWRTVLNWRRIYGIRADGSAETVERRCVNCGVSTPKYLCKGQCEACYWFERKHGRKRTQADVRTPSPRWCKRCKEAEVRSHGYCIACYEYKRRTGKQRPWHLIRRGPCIICGTPYKSQNMGRGRCRNCRSYLEKYGIERPERLWKDSTWCDCGHPATHFGVPLRIITGNGFEIVEHYNLCQSCYDLERS